MVREDFPLLAETGLVYLDNAATTQKPRQVIDAIKEYYERYNANVHRGIYPLARKSTEIYEEAHTRAERFISADPGEVVFVRNTTEGINLVSYILEAVAEEGMNVVVSLSEHHSNLLPWRRLCRKTGMELRIADVRVDGTLDEKKLVSLIDENTLIVAFQHASNVTGYISDVRRVVKVAHQYEALTFLDGAQSVPHIPVDVKRLGIDFMAFSGHKMLGPMGIGVLYGRKEVFEELPPFLEGGDMIKEVRWRDGIEVVYNTLPWKYEAGTPDVASAYGLMAAMDYLDKYGRERIMEHEVRLAKKTMKGLEELGVKVIGGEKRGGVVAFTHPRAFDIALLLGEKNVCVRAGYHCAQPLHDRLGGLPSVRASFYIYNTPEEVDIFISELEDII